MKQYILIVFIKFFYPKYWMLPASLVYAQAWHETGGFKSAIFKENNNLFGMKRSVKRDYDIDSNRGHAVFKSQIDSIKDYFERQLQFKIPYSHPTQYIQDTVNTGYAEDKDYLRLWTNIYENKKYLSTVSLIFLPSVIAIYILIKQLK